MSLALKFADSIIVDAHHSKKNIFPNVHQMLLQFFSGFNLSTQFSAEFWTDFMLNLGLFFAESPIYFFHDELFDRELQQ